MFRIHGIDEPTDPLTSEEWLDFLHPDDRATHVGQRTAAVELGAPMAYEKRIVLPDGSVRQVVVKGEPIRDEDGSVVGVRGTSQDVTEQRRAEADLARTREALFLTELQRRQDHGTVEALQQAVLPEHLPDGRRVRGGRLLQPGRAQRRHRRGLVRLLRARRRPARPGGRRRRRPRAGLGRADGAAAQRAAGLRRARAVAGRAVVGQLNQFLVHLDTDSFATLVYAVYQPSTGSLCWTHAGHPPALRFSSRPPRVARARPASAALCSACGPMPPIPRPRRCSSRARACCCSPTA